MCNSAPFQVLIGFFVKAVLGLTLDPFCKLIHVTLMILEFIIRDILFKALFEWVKLVFINFGGSCL